MCQIAGEEEEHEPKPSCTRITVCVWQPRHIQREGRHLQSQMTIHIYIKCI